MTVDPIRHRDRPHTDEGRATRFHGNLPAPSVWEHLEDRLRVVYHWSLPCLVKYRAWLVTCSHLLIFFVAYGLAYGLRFDFQIPANQWDRFLQTWPLVVSVKLGVFFLFGHFHGWWRYVTFADLAALLRAAGCSLFLLVLINHYALVNPISRSVVILDSLIAVLLLGALRSSWRLLREQLRRGRRNRRQAIMVRTDRMSVFWAHQIESHTELNLHVVGFVDLEPLHRGSRFGGIPVLGTLDDVAAIAASCKATDVLLCADALDGDQLRDFMYLCSQGGLNLKIIPSVVEHLNGTRILPVRDVEINDLLRREPVQLDLQALAQQISGKTVMVTGAGGSIGSEISRQLMPFRPRQLVLVDHGENALFLIHNELLRLDEPTELVPCVADILDRPRLEQLFREYRPDFVLHAAAHKHVGMMELNVGECVKNNVFGTKNVAELAHEYGASKFVLISTDKAVNPASVMGASKQIAERYIHAMAQDSHTAFIAVRFGNVLGSNGSVVPLFKEQIRRGGPITVTDERMTRFFMTIPEASQLVLQAGVMGRGGEIYVLEMGDQMRIVDLARDLIRLSGLSEEAIPIEYVGMRPGEKLYEELYFDEEEALETEHPKLRAAYHRPYSVQEVRKSIRELEDCLGQSDDVVRAKLKELIPEYVFSIHVAQTMDGTCEDTDAPHDSEASADKMAG